MSAALETLSAAATGSIVALEWLDSQAEVSSLAWMDSAALKDTLADPELVTCYSAGYLIHVSDRAVTLAGNVSTGGQCSHVIHIPPVCIVGAEVLAHPEAP